MEIDARVVHDGAGAPAAALHHAAVAEAPRRVDHDHVDRDGRGPAVEVAVPTLELLALPPVHVLGGDGLHRAEDVVAERLLELMRERGVP